MPLTSLGAFCSSIRFGLNQLVTEPSSQASSSATSSWEAGLSSGQTHTISWPNMSTLYIKVCSIDLSSHGKAHILVYADGQSTITCDGSPPTPPTDSPTTETIWESDQGGWRWYWPLIGGHWRLGGSSMIQTVIPSLKSNWIIWCHIYTSS